MPYLVDKLGGAVLRPSINGEDRYLNCQGVSSIAGTLREQSLKEVNKELRRSGLIDQHIPLPKHAPGGNVGVLVGIQDVQLDPVLIAVLPSGISVCRCPFVHVWGSQIAFAGPHPPFTAPTANNYSSSMFSKVTRTPTDTEMKKPNLESLAETHVCVTSPRGDRLTQHRDQCDTDYINNNQIGPGLCLGY